MRLWRISFNSFLSSCDTCIVALATHFLFLTRKFLHEEIEESKEILLRGSLSSLEAPPSVTSRRFFLRWQRFLFVGVGGASGFGLRYAK